MANAVCLDGYPLERYLFVFSKIKLQLKILPDFKSVLGSRKVRTAQYSSSCDWSDSSEVVSETSKCVSNARLRVSTVKPGGFLLSRVLMSKRQVKILGGVAFSRR